MNTDDLRLRGCFVTGTDTGVGKTRVSAALLHWLGAAGQRAAGYKPVAAGLELASDGRWVNEDVEWLRRASSVPLSEALVGPCQLREPCAPHIAAELEGVAIDRVALLRGAQALAQRADFIVAEGAGGLIVPLGRDWDSAQLMRALALPVVLVVGLRLGCLNHALLTAEAIVARGLTLAGWVGSVVDPAMLQLPRNIETLQAELQRRHATPCLGVVPHLADLAPSVVAGHLDGAALRALFGLE